MFVELELELLVLVVTRSYFVPLLVLVVLEGIHNFPEPMKLEVIRNFPGLVKLEVIRS